MNGRMEYRGSRGSSLVPVLACWILLTSAGAYAKSGRGASVIVTLKSGLQASGELIQVRTASLLVLEGSGRDASFDLGEISGVRVIRASKGFQGALFGLLVGAGTGYLAGKAATRGQGFDESFGTKLITFYGGGLAGLIIGGIAGGAAGKDLDFPFEGVPAPALRESLLKLSKHARIRGDA